MSKINNAFLLFFVSIIIFSHYLYGQSLKNSPQKVYRYCYVVNSKEWYTELHVSEPLVNQLNLMYVDPFLNWRSITI